MFNLNGFVRGLLQQEPLDFEPLAALGGVIFTVGNLLCPAAPHLRWLGDWRVQVVLKSFVRRRFSVSVFVRGWGLGPGCRVCNMQCFNISVLILQVAGSSWSVGLFACQSTCKICLEASGIDTVEAKATLLLVQCWDCDVDELLRLLLLLLLLL